MRKLFGLDCETAEQIDELGALYAFSHEAIGRVTVSEAAVGIIADSDAGRDDYQAVCVLHEYSLRKQAVLLCLSSERERLSGFGRGRAALLTPEQVVQLFPSTIDQLQDRIIANLERLAPDFGEELPDLNSWDCFARDGEQKVYFLRLLEEEGWIRVRRTDVPNGMVLVHGVSLEPAGWRHLEALRKSRKSGQVFVAMWFDPSMDNAYEAIAEGCGRCGFRALRIDAKEHNNEISGEILYELRRSSFCVADVSGQRPGVYFEAGYAMGLGLPVIWCCRRDDLENVHFDTRQYSHVVWESPQDLVERIEKRVRGAILP
jgi:hypothetical protein